MEHKFEPFEKVLVRDRVNQKWRADIYSHYESDGIDDFPECKHVTIGCSYKYCIPYEGNERFMGTTDSPDGKKHEYKWGDKVEVCVGPDKWKKAIFLSSYESNKMTFYCTIRDTKSSYGECQYHNIRPLEEVK